MALLVRLGPVELGTGVLLVAVPGTLTSALMYSISMPLMRDITASAAIVAVFMMSLCCMTGDVCFSGPTVTANSLPSQHRLQGLTL